MQIAGREIGGKNPPYIVAEISGNHCGSWEEANRLINAAKVCGADAVKIQVYEPETLTIDCDSDDFILKEGPWKGKKLFELYKHAYTPFCWLGQLFGHAAREGITIFGSVFDRGGVDLLESLGCPAYKIASFEIVDIPLIAYAAKTGKPLIISTGMASDEEISDALYVLGRGGGNTAILHCISGYPTPIAESNLRHMKELARYINCKVGISDHTLGWEIPVAATALGASIIEKHLIMSREMPSEDSDFSLTPSEFKLMVDKVREIWKAMQPSEAKSEESSRQARRSLYVVEDIAAGEVFTEQNIRSIRPAYGLPPKELPNVLGEFADRDLKRGTALQWDMILNMGT